MNILSKVKRFIDDNRLISNHGTVIVALSGGADSVALLHILSQLDYSLIAAHCNFHLRGEESDRDETFVTQLTRRLNIPCKKISFDTQAYSKQHDCSIEMAARELRYIWFEKLRQEENAEVVAVAHHADDSVETILLNLIRGTGIHGLIGIQAQRDAIVRPLLILSKGEILSYLKEMNETYITDSTNLTDEYTRNKIRLKLIPLMQEINPSVKESIIQTAHYLSELSSFTDQQINKEKKCAKVAPDTIQISSLTKSPLRHTLLFDLLKEYHFNQAQVKQIDSILEGESGKCFYSKDYRLVKEREQLVITPFTTECLPDIIINPADKEAERGEQKLLLQTIAIDSSFKIPKGKNHVALNSQKITYPLLWRSYQKGDSFCPFGMKGRKKLSDFFTDKKYTQVQKESMTILCDSNTILWVVGERIDNRFRVTKETKAVLDIQLLI